MAQHMAGPDLTSSWFGPIGVSAAWQCAVWLVLRQRRGVKARVREWQLVHSHAELTESIFYGEWLPLGGGLERFP